MTYWAEGGSYTGLDVTTAKTAEPSMNWIAATQPNRGEMDIQVASGSELLLVALSAPGQTVDKTKRDHQKSNQP